MSPLDAYLSVGETLRMGSHTFGAEEIKAFAAKYDPQRFHMDEEEARHSVFGGLCASGWHTTAMWMRFNLETREDLTGKEWTGDGAAPAFGPSPGFTKLRWLKPVFAGETITFTRQVTGHRALASRPGWRLATIACGAEDAGGTKVLEFESTVLIQAS